MNIIPPHNGMLNVNDFASNPNGTLDSIFHLIPLLAAESYLTAFDSVQRSHQERAFLTLSTPHQPSVRRAARPWEPIGRCPRRHRMSLGMSLLWHCTLPPPQSSHPLTAPRITILKLMWKSPLARTRSGIRVSPATARRPVSIPSSFHD